MLDQSAFMLQKRCLIVLQIVAMMLFCSYNSVCGWQLQPKSTANIVEKETLKNVFKGLSLLSIGIAASTIAQADGKLEYMPALQGLDYGKPRTYYPDYTQMPSGLQYKMVKEGTGAKPVKVDRVVLDWEGYTIRYYGRPFQIRNKVKGGAFDSAETDYFRFIVGSNSAVQALDEAVQYLSEGGIMQVVVPAELGYPIKGDPEHDVVGPKPSTFSGLRALNFVLDNQSLVDKTLLINIRMVKVEANYAKRKGITL